MRAIITVGVSASGKSTWAREYAKEHKAIISNRDDLRFSLTGASGWGEYKFDKKIEGLITKQQQTLAVQAADLRKDFIVADTNLNPDIRNKWVDYLASLGYTVEIKDFPITLEEAWKRDSLRGNGVGRDVIYKQWQQWLKYIGRKQYVADATKPKVIIFDIDGTLAHMDGRGPFEWDKVHLDQPDNLLFSVANSLAKDNTIIFVSGRDGVCYKATYDFLDFYFDEDVNLLMREKGDSRKDTIIKEEIFWRDIAPNYNVVAVVDDRPCVVRMWHDLGIPKVIAVGNQNVEF